MDGRCVPSDAELVEASMNPQPYIEANDRERARLRALVARLTDADLERQVNESWTVAGVLVHIAFWDLRAQYLAGKLERGQAFTESDAEPDDPAWVNDATRPLIHAIPPRAAADLALRVAEETDARVAALEASRMWPADPDSLLNAFRSEHRREHLDEVGAALGSR